MNLSILLQLIRINLQVKGVDISEIAKVATLATKAELKAEQDKIIKLQAFDSSYFCGKSHFEDDGTEKLFSVSANAQIF